MVWLPTAASTCNVRVKLVKFRASVLDRELSFDATLFTVAAFFKSDSC